MLYIIVAILIFGVLIATHELGHFASAKLLGVKVNEFAVGMGRPCSRGRKGRPFTACAPCPSGATAPWRGRTTTPPTPAPSAGRRGGRS